MPKIISQYNYNPIDAVQQTVRTSLNGPALDIIERDNISHMRQARNPENVEEHFIIKDQPRVFDFNGKLMVRGSELLQYPSLYTHMGWMNMKDSNIIPDQYYQVSDGGLIDPTHFSLFTNSDTYIPIPDWRVNQTINQIISNNIRSGQKDQKRKQGAIFPGKDETIKEQITPGFSEGADVAYLNYLNGRTAQAADNYMSVAKTTSSANRAIASLHPYAGPFYGTIMGADALDTFSNAKDGTDFAIGAGQSALAALGFAGPFSKLYRSIRSAVSPQYALSKAIDSAPLDAEMYNSYRASIPQQHYYFSDWQTFGGRYPFSYQAGHMHNIDVSDIGRILVRHGYFDNPSPGQFVLNTTLPSGRQVLASRIETQPTNYPIQIGANPELPVANWGKRVNRSAPERVISSKDVPSTATTNQVRIIGNVGQDGNVFVISAYPNMGYAPRAFSKLFEDLNSNNPSYDIAGEINQARTFWDTHAIVDDNTTPARDPFKRGAKKSFVPYTFPNRQIPTNQTTYNAIWNSGKQQTIDYITSPTHKERLMNQLKITEQQADALIQQELRNLENVELVNLGQYKIGRPFGHTIAYTVEGQSGNGQADGTMFSRIKNKSAWMPNHWSEQQYRNFIDPYVQHATAYDKAKQGITQVGISEGDKPALVNAGFKEGTHATTRGGTDPALASIIEHDTKLASALLGQNPGMLDPIEARTVGMELDRAWEALKDHLPEYYNKLSPSAQRRQFFYDILRASDDGGEEFYRNVPQWWAKRFDPKFNNILNKGTNGLDPDEAFYNFWENFVYNTQPNDNSIT